MLWKKLYAFMMYIVKASMLFPHGKYNIDKDKAIRLIKSSKVTKGRMRLTLLGDLREYKNAEWAAEFICNLNRSLPDSHFIELRIAGKSTSNKQSDLLHGLSEKYDFISLKLQRLSDDQLHQEFCDSDFIFVPYSKILTSGICINALSHGRPLSRLSFHPYLSCIVKDIRICMNLKMRL